MMNEPIQKAAFSWGRVFFVVVIIAFIASFLFWPSVGSHRAPLHLQNLNNLHQFGIAITNYAMTNKELLPGNHGLHSWRVAVCQELDRADIFRSYDFAATWDAASNEKFTKKWIPVMKSPHRPSRLDENGRGYADYGLISGPGTVNPSEGPVTLDFISAHDGLGATLLVGECSGLQLIWTEPRDPDVSQQTLSLAPVTSRKPLSNHLLSSYSAYGAAGLFGDGSGKLLSYKIDPQVLEALCTVNGGETVQPQDFQ